MGAFVFHCSVIVLALYLASLHCIAVASMAFNASVVMAQQTLEYWWQIRNIVPAGRYSLAEAYHCIEEYVNKVYQRSQYTENVVFNFVLHQELKLILCLSSPMTTRAYNEKIQHIEHGGRVVDIGDPDMWTQIGSWTEQYMYIWLVFMIDALLTYVKWSHDDPLQTELIIVYLFIAMLIWGIRGEPYWQFMDFYVYEGAMLDNLGGLVDARYHGTQVDRIALVEVLVTYCVKLGQTRANLLHQADCIAGGASLMDSMWSFVCLSQSDRKLILYVIFCF